MIALVLLFLISLLEQNITYNVRCSNHLKCVGKAFEMNLRLVKVLTATHLCEVHCVQLSSILQLHSMPN